MTSRLNGVTNFVTMRCVKNDDKLLQNDKFAPNILTKTVTNDALNQYKIIQRGMALAILCVKRYKTMLSMFGYLELIERGIGADDMGALVAMMPVSERIKLRNDLEMMGCEQMVRTLWYDYETQRFF
jgi:hypothetical protein